MSWIEGNIRKYSMNLYGEQRMKTVEGFFFSFFSYKKYSQFNKLYTTNTSKKIFISYHRKKKTFLILTLVKVMNGLVSIRGVTVTFVANGESSFENLI